MATIKLLGLQKDFQAHQGNDFMADFELFNADGTRLDMTDYLIASEIRYSANGRGAIVCTLANGYLGWTNKEIGKFKLRIPAAATTDAVLQFQKSSPESLDLVYDIEVTSPNSEIGRFKPFYGTITLMREQTRIS